MIQSLVKIIFLIIGSWVLVHILSIVGLFLGVAYPIWWLVAPGLTKCIVCQGHVGGRCVLCRDAVERPGPPKNFRSASLNGGLILMLSLASILMVFIESVMIHKSGIVRPPQTVSLEIQAAGQYRLGEIFPLKVEITGIETAINAVQVDLGFDPNYLEAVVALTNESFAEIFIQKEINNTGGYVRLSGGLPDPGFFAERGLFGTIFFGD